MGASKGNWEHVLEPGSNLKVLGSGYYISVIQTDAIDQRCKQGKLGVDTVYQGCKQG